MVTASARIGKRHALVIPKKVRESIALKEGDRVLLEVRDGKVIIEPMTDPWAELARLVPGGYDEARDEAAAESRLVGEGRRRDARRRH